MIAVSYSLSVVLMLLLPIGLLVLLRRRFRPPLILFVVGAATFAGSQLVHLPLNNWLADIGLLPGGGSSAELPLWRTALVLGLTAGICEESARAAGYALLRRVRRFEEALMMGLGHGGLESMLFGGVLTAAAISSLLPLRGTDLQSLDLSPEQLAAVSRQLEMFAGPAWYAAVPFLERLLAMGIQLVLSVMVWQAFSRRSGLYFLGAVGYHALIDSTAVYLAGRTDDLWVIYSAVVALAVPGWIWLWKLRPRERLHRAPPLSAGWASFAAATRKELLQQWRTKRLLVVLAVFAAFGLASPLLARFAPELLRTIEGAEQFADLIPEPTAADAVAQYIKNLTQFGFILVLVLGMGAVAGEKEKGTAAMILSKPMPRWAFVVSKFVAQAGVFTLAFAVAALGAYYYTRALFGPVKLGWFAAASLLLLLWLLTFVAVTLLGSTLGRSTAAAAGIGLGGSVLLLLAGSLPRVGALAPGGLVAWASQLGTGAGGPPNWGAVAMSLVTVLMCLVSAVAVFETQEL